MCGKPKLCEMTQTTFVINYTKSIKFTKIKLEITK